MMINNQTERALHSKKRDAPVRKKTANKEEGDQTSAEPERRLMLDGLVQGEIKLFEYLPLIDIVCIEY